MLLDYSLIVDLASYFMLILIGSLEYVDNRFFVWL
jgi:hypothetical protein